MHMNTSSNSIPVTIPLAGPAMKAAGAFAAGIAACGFLRVNIPVLFFLAVTGTVLLIALHSREKTGSRLALLVLFLAGMFAHTLRHDINRPLEIPETAVYRSVIAEGTVSGSTKISYENTRFTLRCRTLRTDTLTYHTGGLLPCVVYGREIDIPEGSHVIMEGMLKRYRRPLRSRGLFRLSPYPDFTHRLTTDSGRPAPVIVKRGNSLFGRIRTHLSHAADRYSFGGYGGLFKALTIGERNALPQSARTRFAQSGIAHILAISGLHLGIFALVLNCIFGFLPLSRKVRSLIVICILFFYAGICGFRPPVMRAVIMISMVFGALIFERPKNIENTLFFALIVILACDPESLFGPSLQLSFAAVWGITTFYSPLTRSVTRGRRLPVWIRYFAGIFVVSVIANILTAPIVSVHFGSMALYSIPVNLIVIPLTFCIIVCGLCSWCLISLGSVAAPLAAVSSHITGFFLRFLSLLTEYISGLPHATVSTGSISPLWGITLVIWLYIISRSQGRRTFKKAVLYIPLTVMLFSTWYPLLSSEMFGKPHGSVVFFDVGQGDSALVRYGRSRSFLVDAGPRFGTYDAGASLIVPSLKNIGVSRLDGLILSHIHTDHSGGIESVIENIPTTHIFCRRAIADSLSAVFGESVIGVSAGDSIAFKEGGILILSPAPDEESYRARNITGENNYSVLARFDMEGVRLLFTGDIERDAQHLMLSWGKSLKSDILKVPHHGAPGLMDEFISAVHPELAVISCGANNRYGHPGKITLERLARRGANVYRTDRDGTIVIAMPSPTVSSY